MGTGVSGGPSRTGPTTNLEPQSSSRTINTETHIDTSHDHQRRTGFYMSGLHLHFGTGGTHQHVVPTGRTETSSSPLQSSGPSLTDVLVVKLFANKGDPESDTEIPICDKTNWSNRDKSTIPRYQRHLYEDPYQTRLKEYQFVNWEKQSAHATQV